MGLKSKLAILGLAGSLAFGREVYAQTPRTDSTRVQPNTIYSRNAEYSASGEGIFLKDFVYTLPDSSVNLERWLGLYARRGNLSYHVVDTRKGLENVLSFLRRGTQTPEKRASINYIQGLSRTIPETDSASLSALRRAVRDGVLTTEEIAGINPNTYMLIARSPSTQRYKAQSMYILVNAGARSLERPEARPPVRPRHPGRIRPRPPRRPEARPDTLIIREPAEDTLPAEIDTLRRPERPIPRRRLRPQIGIEADYGSNDEFAAGIFGNVPLNQWARLEVFGNYSFLKGNSYTTDKPRTEITERGSQLIGPDTYKFRTDKITTSKDDRGIAEAGLGITLVPHNCGCIELPFRVGVKRLKRTETTDATSTIRFERPRGQQLGDEEVITNTLEDKTFVNHPSFSAGVRFGLGRHFGLGAFYNRVGKKNNGKINFRFNF